MLSDTYNNGKKLKKKLSGKSSQAAEGSCISKRDSISVEQSLPNNENESLKNSPMQQTSPQKKDSI